MGVLGNKGPLSNILSEEGVEAEPAPSAAPSRPPPILGLSPGAANEPGLRAPPIMPAAMPRGRQRQPFSAPVPEMQPTPPVTPGIKLPDPELAAREAMPRTRGTNRPRTDPRAMLRDIYERRAGQMALPVAGRVQPRPQDAVIDTDYGKPGPKRNFPDLSATYPRQVAGGRMPLNDRTRPLVDHADEIAERYAQYIRESGVMESDVAQFYHVDGPIYRAARKLGGLSNDEALRWLDDFSQFMAATSPRTQTEPNVRNALSAMAKTAQGIPHREIVGPGTANEEGGGISETGYPMMTGKGGIHGKLLDAVIGGQGISREANTKPSIFGPNMAGNRSGATIDVHIIKGLLMTLNDLYPGSLPPRWLVNDPAKIAAYRANPANLTADMINETLETAQVGGRKFQVEYPAFADIIHKVADKLQVPKEDVADVQAYGWFALGNRTNLGSDFKTAVDLLNERISVTAQLTGKPPKEIARMLFRREIPLASLFGLAVGAGAMQGQGQSDDITDTVTGTPPPMTPERFQQLIDYMRQAQ